MSWFSRGGKPKPSESRVVGAQDDAGDDPLVQEITVSKPGANELEQIRIGLARAAGLGIDPDDIGSISAAFDRLLATSDAGAEVDAEDIAAIGTAIGEYLSRNGFQWAIVTDSFGTDLGVAAKRRNMTSIPHTLVATRWMRGERGWVPGVVAHLAETASRR